MAVPSCPRLLIVDQSLRDLNGHHFEYDLSIAQQAAGQGVAPHVLAHTSFNRIGAFDAIPVEPWFKQSFYESNRSGLIRLAHRSLGRLPADVRAPLLTGASGVVRWLRKSKPRNEIVILPSFGQELRSFLVREGYRPHDYVLIHTLSIPELHSVLAALGDLPECPTLHIVLRRDADEPGIRSGAWDAAPGAFAHVRAHASLGQRMVFHTDSEALTQQYQEMAPDLPFHVLPIPHILPDTIDYAAPRRPGPLRLTYLGNARTEKGYDLLPGLMAALGDTVVDGERARLVVQSNFSMSLEEQRIVRARKDLSRYPTRQVELFNEELNQQQFQSLLLDADIVLLPYDALKYRCRSSGILVQALVAGKPVVVPDGTWLSDTVMPEAAARFARPQHFADAVSEAVERFSEKDAAAKRAAPEWRKRHNAAALIQRLKETSPPQTSAAPLIEATRRKMDAQTQLSLSKPPIAMPISSATR